MKILKSDKMKSVPRNGYEINFVICEAHEICQPLSNKGDLAEIGYSFFYSFLNIPQLEKDLSLSHNALISVELMALSMDSET